MPYLKKVTKKGNDYYYLFHTVRDGDKFKKLSKYLGKKRPSNIELKKLKDSFIDEINKEKVPSKEEILKVNVMGELQKLQKKKGFLSRAELIKLSKEKKISGVDLYGVVTFYSQFRITKPAKYKIAVCRGTACHIKNSDTLLSFLEEHLGIKAGEKTKDGKISLEVVNCIGACAKAPAVMVNGKVYGDMNKKKIKKLIENLT